MKCWSTSTPKKG